MLSICRYYVRDLHYAEDVMMHGFLKAFTQLHQLADAKQFGGWLRRIMINEALMHLRSKKSLSFTDLETAYPLSASPTINPIFDMEEIQMWIDQLPETQRVIFILYAIEEYTHRDIASQLNIPEGTSKVYLSRARYFLQQKIKNHRASNNEQA